jgi:hypothetical protein
MASGAVGAGVGLVSTELFGMVLASWRLHHHYGYRTPVTFLLRVLAPMMASVAVTLLLSGQHVVLMVIAESAPAVAALIYPEFSTWETCRQQTISPR